MINLVFGNFRFDPPARHPRSHCYPVGRIVVFRYPPLPKKTEWKKHTQNMVVFLLVSLQSQLKEGSPKTESPCCSLSEICFTVFALLPSLVGEGHQNPADTLTIPTNMCKGLVSSPPGQPKKVSCFFKRIMANCETGPYFVHLGCVASGKLLCLPLKNTTFQLFG